MKEVLCEICGNIIQNEWDNNPQNSDICRECLEEEDLT